MEIKLKYVRNIKPIEKISVGDWIDLRCAETIHLEKNQFYIIPLGVAMKLPDGYEGIIAPRSSTYKKWGIIAVNSIGIIDNSYCGNNDEWSFPCLALRDTVIYKNDRICQFRIIKNMGDIKIKVTDKLSDKNRGGFGSTGAQ